MNSVESNITKEEELVAQLKQHDTKAISLIYDNYSKALFGVIFRIVNDQETAEDSLQEVFIKIWKNAESYDSSKGRLFTWMVNIARNTAIDKVRSKDFRLSGQIQSIDKSVYRINSKYNTSNNIDQIGLRKLVDELKPEHRILVDKIYFEGYTQSEIADELNIPLGTVKTRIKMAMNDLRAIFK